MTDLQQFVAITLAIQSMEKVAQSAQPDVQRRVTSALQSLYAAVLILEATRKPINEQ